MTEEQKKTIGKCLKMARAWLNLNANELAKSAGISDKQVRQLEEPGSKGALVKYLFFLREKGVNINELFDRLRQE